MMNVPRFAVILSGCGYKDGTEVNEAVIALLAINKAGASYELFAPNVDQQNVIDHITGKSSQEKRNALTEAARIARGKISDILDLDPNQYDALIIPGGTGVVTTLSSVTEDVMKSTVLPSVQAKIIDFFRQKKPIGAICIAPALIAKILRPFALDLKLTLGKHNNLLDILEVTQEISTADEIVVDKKNKIVSCPAFMIDNTSLSTAAAGIFKLVDEILLFVRSAK